MTLAFGLLKVIVASWLVGVAVGVASGALMRLVKSLTHSGD
jgi:hypothetical protein